MKKWIYLDNAATTKPLKEVVAASIPYMEEYYGNAGSSYGLGVESNKAVNQARRSIAATIEAKPEEILFTSGGTEADNWAILGVAYANQEKGKHIITTKIEHPAVLNACKRLEEQGFTVTYLNVDEEGYVSTEALEHAIRQDTILISVMYANNEVGTIQPIREIAQIAHAHQILFHVDAVQAYGQIPISAKNDGFDLLSVSGHKFHGPKGVGFLYVKRYSRIAGWLMGGMQEYGMRAGTENVAGIVGMAKAAQIAHENMQQNIIAKRRLRDLFARLLQEQIGEIEINGSGAEEKRLPGNLHVSFLNTEAEQILIHLDRQGICASGGSACTSKDRKPSHVLVAMGKNAVQIRGAVRFSLSHKNTEEEIRYTVQVLQAYLRAL